MIWLITLFLLAVFAWFLLNGLNEKQWVDAHMHDETVASDKGLFASFTALGDGDKDDRVGNVVDNLKKKSADASSALGEKLSDARQSETAGKMREKTSGIRERVRNEVNNEDGMFNKIKNSVSDKVDKVGKKVDEKIVNRDK